jgi:hypothetical protein
VVAAIGTLTTVISIALLFIAPSGTKSVVTFETNLILQSLAALAAGLVIQKLYQGRPAD